MAKNLTAVSFFAGCGGLDLGFLGGFSYKGTHYQKHPVDVLGAYDFDEKCIVTYKQNIGDHAKVLDLSSYDPSAIPKADILLGGFPCQDFATCGPRQGLGSERGKLYRALITYMDCHNPKLVVGENVPGLETVGGGEVLSTIIRDLESAGSKGYKVHQWKLFGPNYGLPQTRTRIFLVAIRNDLDFVPTEPKKLFQQENYRTAKWAIEDLEGVTDESVPNQSQFFLASRAKKGNGQGDEKTPIGMPSYTIRANAKSRVQFHYSLDRRLTVRECARLQSFPDNFIFPHAATTSMRQIGNAVPPMLAYKVAKCTLKLFETLARHEFA
jgi:DNA (cytosine-5)-methyltransferase 1